MSPDGEWPARILWIGLGGFLGANARYWLGAWVQTRWGAPEAGLAFPWGTFVVNITGSFLLGVFVGMLAERSGLRSAAAPAAGAPLAAAPALRLLLAVGFLGAYTTFSTFTYEAVALLEAGDWPRALGSVLGSLAAGLLAVWAGLLLGRAL